jgi:hypothetical protein
MEVFRSLINPALLAVREGDSRCDSKAVQDAINFINGNPSETSKDLKGPRIEFLSAVRSDDTLFTKVSVTARNAFQADCEELKMKSIEKIIEEYSDCPHIIADWMNAQKSPLSALLKTKISPEVLSAVLPLIHFLSVDKSLDAFLEKDPNLLKECTNVKELKINRSKITLDQMPDLSEAIDVNIRGAFSLKALPALPKARSVNLSSCFSVERVGDLLSAETVSITNCKLLEGFSALPEVKDLKIQDCPVLKKVGDLPKAREVEIERCDAVESLGHMKELRKLKLDSCDTVSTFGEMPELREASISGASSLKELPLARKLGKLFISHLPALRELREFPQLKDLSISSLPILRELREFPELKDLSISDLPILRELREFPELKDLSISDLPILRELREFPELENLHLQDCDELLSVRHFPKLKIASIKDCEKLQELDLSHVSGVDIASCPSVKELDLSNCLNCSVFKCEGLEQIGDLLKAGTIVLLDNPNLATIGEFPPAGNAEIQCKRNGHRSFYREQSEYAIAQVADQAFSELGAAQKEELYTRALLLDRGRMLEGSEEGFEKLSRREYTFLSQSLYLTKDGEVFLQQHKTAKKTGAFIGSSAVIGAGGYKTAHSMEEMGGNVRGVRSVVHQGKELSEQAIKCNETFFGSPYLLAGRYRKIQSRKSGDFKEVLISYQMETTLVEKVSKLPQKLKTEAMLQVAKGLKTMHDKNWVHYDIKGLNIFMNYDEDEETVDVRLADFDTAQEISETTIASQEGTEGLQAPEIFDSQSPPIGREANKACDIFSFGMTFSKYSCDAPVKALAAEMCDKDPKKRPTIDQVIKRLEDILEGDAARESGND